MNDRIEAGTFLCVLGAATGELILEHAPINYMKTTIEKLVEAGLTIDLIGSDTIRAVLRISFFGGEGV
jgi:UDP-N-acetylglucosamine 1-carboxyvinyltransferase